jgi:hypothetical protein
MASRKQSSSPGLSSGQSAYVLERLISERRVSPGDVNRIISEMGREISELEAKLQRLREAHGGGSTGSAAPAPVRRGPGRPPGSGRGPGRPPGSGRRRGRPGRPPAAAAPAAAPAAAAAPAKAGGKKRGRKAAITPEQLASRQLQGRYLALVRQFPASRRAAYAKTAKEKGREAAIREMQDARK